MTDETDDAILLNRLTEATFPTTELERTLCRVLDELGLEYWGPGQMDQYTICDYCHKLGADFRIFLPDHPVSCHAECTPEGQRQLPFRAALKAKGA